ncbi:MAG TPA: c-type cytochrome [Polyangia bacterium]|jgi:mono/diheme cytochrome c family protein|nr:c-type cytochrome [Polyangia bacterium]
MRTALLLPVIAVAAVAAGLGSGCKTQQAEMPAPVAAPVTLGGRVVSPAQLRHGGHVYTHYCRACHGAAGDGKGPAAPGLRPAPRDLRLGVYKFGGVPAGQLPTDQDFKRIIKSGLHGTAMLSWDVPDAELDDLIQYMKFFSPRWRTESAGEPIAITPDPWAGRTTEAVQRGEKVYHGLAQCAVACHPNYITKPEIYQHAKELTGMLVSEFRPDLYAPVIKDSDYGVKILPPDFTWTLPRSGDTPKDIYRSIAAGIGGTAMPTWKGVLPEEDLWAMAHYVRSLVMLRGTAAATELRQRLVNQPPWTPPPPPSPDAPDGGTGISGDAR